MRYKMEKNKCSNCGKKTFEEYCCIKCLDAANSQKITLGAFVKKNE